MTKDDINNEMKIITLAELKSTNINTVLANVCGSDQYALQKPLREAASLAQERGQANIQRAFQFLQDLLNIRLRVEDRAEPFGPIFQSASGRTCTASDFSGEQNGIIAEFVPFVDHPVLKARLADIA